jgi:hypothetical protein
MRQEGLKELLRRDPCPLVRLHLTGGRTFDIRDPEEVVVTHTTVQFLLPGEKDREAVINLLHIVWVEVISAP